MKIIIKYSDDHIKIKFLNNINYKIKSDLSKICDITTLEYKREQNEIEELIENCNNIIEQIKDEKKKLKKWWKIKKSNEEIKLLEIQTKLEIKRIELATIKESIVSKENIKKEQLKRIEKYLNKNNFILMEEIKGIKQIYELKKEGEEMYLDVLKSCPFCGSKPEMLETYHKSIKYYIICKNCNIKTYEYDYRLDAINTWNRRIKKNG